MIASHLKGRSSLGFTRDGVDNPKTVELKNSLLFEAELAELSATFSRVDHVSVECPLYKSVASYVTFYKGANEVSVEHVTKLDILPVAVLTHDFDPLRSEGVERSYFFETAEEAVEFRLRYL